MVFSEAFEVCDELMVDVFGNYVIQKLLEFGMLTCSFYMFRYLYVIITIKFWFSCELSLSRFFAYCMMFLLIRAGLDSHRTLLADRISGNAFTLSVHTYGCRVVQKALEVLKPPLQGLLVQNLHSRVLTLVEDQNGNHVIQKVRKSFGFPLL